MSKWLIWTLLELATFLFVANIIFLWLSHRLNKKHKKNEERDPKADKTPLDLDSIKTSNDTAQPNTNAYKKFAQYIDQQISYAASIINPDQPDQHETNTIKLWGTILKAERAIVLNQVSEKPKPILNRFLANLLYALSAPKLQTTDTEELQKSLKEMEEEFLQASEVLIAKESLTEKQQSLNGDLRTNIDRVTKHVKQLGIKKTELQRLQIELDNLQKKIKKLEATQKEHSNDFSEIQIHSAKTDKIEKQSRNSSFKQVSALRSLSDRQQMVIDQLKSEIDKAKSNNSSQDAIEAQRIAANKIERMCQESQTLITQLEAELETSSLSIASLRQNIEEKDEQLAALERQLTSNNQTAMGNLQTLNENKKETLTSLRDDLNLAMESRSTDSLIEQDKDTQMLERLLLESETCVTLLAQELDSAEEENENLKQKVDAIKISESGTHQESKSLLEQREKNRDLAQKTTDLKNKLLELTSNKNFQELRVEYNKKSLECDRLQLAFSDLEIKYLGTLN